MQRQPGSEAAIDARRVRTIITVRWLGALFAVGQVLGYRTMPYPEGLREAALAIVAVIVVSNAGAELWWRRVETPADVRRLALVVLVVDVLCLSGLTWVYSFDDLSALFAVLFLLPIEAAVVFGLPGALWTWVAVAVLYTGREWFSTRYGQLFEWESITFRVGLIGIVALVVGLLVRDLVAQRRATAAALEEAERSEESRSRLVSMLAHDVRAPMAAARSAFDTLIAGGGQLEPAVRDRVIRAGRRQVDRALLLARDLLDLARVEAGTLTVDPAEVELAGLVETLDTVLADRTELEVDVGDLQVVADPARLEQVLFNLVDNAAKHGEPPVEVTARRDGDHVELTVRDHGPGVPAGVELFTPFSHAGEGSVGLGMWVVRQLVGAMGGTVRHEDADPGARMVLTLPATGGTAALDQAPGAPSSAASGTTSPVSRS